MVLFYFQGEVYLEGIDKGLAIRHVKESAAYIKQCVAFRNPPYDEANARILIFVTGMGSAKRKQKHCERLTMNDIFIPIALAYPLMNIIFS